MPLRLFSNAFQANGDIPLLYTCEGQNISPPLKWEGAPKGTKSFALIVDDPDAPRKTWVHWVVYNIPAEVTEAMEGAPPEGSTQGTNDYEKVDYKGPCPPSGKHRYFFKLYALDQMLDLPDGAGKEETEKAMKNHVLDKVEFIGKYERQNGQH